MFICIFFLNGSEMQYPVINEFSVDVAILAHLHYAWKLQAHLGSGDRKNTLLQGQALEWEGHTP